MGREVEAEYGCFLCGTKYPDVHLDELDREECAECGQRGIVSLQQALDMLNDMYRYHRRELENVMENDEYYIEYKEVEKE